MYILSHYAFWGQEMCVNGESVCNKNRRDKQSEELSYGEMSI